jgi:hypothetical protein
MKPDRLCSLQPTYNILYLYTHTHTHNFHSTHSHNLHSTHKLTHTCACTHRNTETHTHTHTHTYTLTADWTSSISTKEQLLFRPTRIAPTASTFPPVPHLPSTRLHPSCARPATRPTPFRAGTSDMFSKSRISSWDAVCVLRIRTGRRRSCPPSTTIATGEPCAGFRGGPTLLSQTMSTTLLPLLSVLYLSPSRHPP